MGKNRSKRRRQEREQQHVQHRKDDSKPADGLVSMHISPEELLITVETLQTIANKYAGNDLLNALLQNTMYKELRGSLNPFTRALHTRYDPISFPARVTIALSSGNWTDSLFALQGCMVYEAGETGAVKRGTLQRWVRLCDDCPYPNLKMKILRGVLACSPKDDDDGYDDGNENGELNRHDPRRLALLEKGAAAMEFKNAMDLGDIIDNNREGSAEDDEQEMNIVRTTEWCAPIDTGLAKPLSLEEEQEQSVQGTSLGKTPFGIETVHHVLAAERKPANNYDLKIYATPPNTIKMETNRELLTERHDVEPVPGAFMITDVLSQSECQQILRIAETMGYIPDHPVASLEPTGIDTCEWLVDSSILEPITKRVMRHLPQLVHHEEVGGVNARWRLFRYGNNSVYRPHIDGSWPGSGRDEEGGYTSDTFDGDRRSRFTFLIYLNDIFEGGGTTFYLPAVQTAQNTVANANGSEKKTENDTKPDKDGFEIVTVKPRAGSVLCFPQANTATLLHEGSRVTGGGSKYVIRTDVLYLTSISNRQAT